MATAIGRGALTGGVAGAVTGLLGPAAGCSVWAQMGVAGLGGAAANVAGQAYDNATGVAQGFDAKSLIRDAAISAATAGVLHFLPVGGGGCFDGDTLVQISPQVAMATGKTGSKATATKGKTAKTVPAPKIATSTKKIKEIRKGDLVATRNETTGKTEFKKVTRTSVRTSDHLISVALADKTSDKIVETLQTTRQHPFYVAGKGFVPAGGLAIGNAIVTRAGPSLIVKSIQWHRRAEGYTVYNFEVEDDHSYFVGKEKGGTWVHNGAPCNPDLVPGADENGQLSLFTPEEHFQRMKHYGRTPTRPQANSVPAGTLFDHDPPLAQHYYEGDGKGGIPGYMMTPKDRMAYGKSLSVGKPATPEQRFSQGGLTKPYSMRKRMYWFGY